MFLRDVYARPANNLIRHIPPHTPCEQQRYVIRDITDCICRVYGDMRDEIWDYHKLRDQNLL